MKFFNSWALWQKMTFVLACAIVVVILLGCIKLAYTHWRVRKYTALEARQGVQMRERVPPDEEQAIPFGIRAIESGIRVDGVWISGRTSAVTSAAASPAPSIRSERLAPGQLPTSMSEASRVAAPPTTSAPPPGSRPSSVDLSSMYERRASAEVPVPRPASPKPTRQKRPPPSLSRYSHRHLFRSSPNLNVLDGMERRKAKTSVDSKKPFVNGHSSGSSEDSTDKEERERANAHVSRFARMVADEPANLNGLHIDLDLLQCHRLSHVAETGQLTPRTRRGSPYVSGATTPIKPDGEDYFSSPATPMPTETTKQNPFTTPSVSSATNLTSVTEKRQPVSPIVSRLRIEDEGCETSPPGSLNSVAGTNGHISHQKPSSTTTTSDASFVAERTQQQRQSAVVRKVNSGFEILAPGTLSRARTSHEDVTEAKKEKRHSKKLQKRPRQSLDL